MATSTLTVKIDATKTADRLRRAANVLDGPDFGDRVEDGGLMGTIVRCEMCGGSGQLHDPDEVVPEPVAPDDPPSNPRYEVEEHRIAGSLTTFIVRDTEDAKWVAEFSGDRHPDARCAARDEADRLNHIHDTRITGRPA